MLNEGDKVANFKLSGIDEKGKEKDFSLKDFSGKQLVLYFYPRDNTSGCTKEACGFRDNMGRVAKKVTVVGVSPDQYAVIQIAITDKKTIKEAADGFFGQEGLSAEQPETGKNNGMPEISGVFTVPTQQVVLQGFAVFIAYKKNTYQVLGYTTEEKWPEFEPAITASARSFNRLTDKKVLSVKPMRLKVITLDKETTLEEFADRFPSPVSIETLALINNVGRNERMQAGKKLKQVVGEKVQ